MASNGEKPAGAHIEMTDSSLTHDAAQGTELEHNLTLVESFRKHPAAVWWTIVVCCACVMEGYDTAFISNLYALPAFQKQFGVPVDGGYQVPARWQTALSLGGSVGIIIGTYLNGYLAEKIGMKRTMLGAYVAVTLLTFILVFGQSAAVILVGQILCGIPWGVFGTMAPAYATEVCPVVLRGYLTTFINITWIIGQLVAAGVLRGVENMEGRWAYDIVFAVQWVWPIPLFILTAYCPESPYWLIRKDRLNDAEHSLRRLFGEDRLKERLAMMVHTHQREIDVEKSSGSYMDCLRGVNLRRTEIAFFTMGIQMLSGLPLQGYNTYFFEQAGLSVTQSFNLSIGYYIIGFAGTIISWFLITWFGRRPIFVTGLGVMSSVFLIIGFVALSPKSNVAAEWAQAVLLVVWVFIYDMTVGPLAFCLVAEGSATRLRNKTVAIGRSAFYFWQIIFAVVTPYMLNPGEANWQGKTAFFYGGTCFCAFVWAFFRLPEFKGRTYEELDILFEKRVPARKFKSTKVDAYSPDELKESA